MSHSFPSVTVFQDQLCDPFEHGVLRFAPSSLCSSCRREAHHEPAEAQHHEPAQAQLHVSFSPHCCPWGNTPHCQDEEELPEASEVRGPSGLLPLTPASRCHNAGFHWPNTRAPCFHEVLLSGFSLPRPRTAFALVVSLTEPLSSIVY